MQTLPRLWAILPQRLPLLIEQLKTGIPLKASWCAAKPSTQGTGKNKLAVIPIQGVLTKDGPDYIGTTYGSIADAAERAADDPAVKRIVLAVDSPGGEVIGLPETAAVIARVARAKPVSAIVDGMAASAAYWLTSQATDITMSPSAEVGSVGVRMMHMDISKNLEDAGIKVTELHSGKFKTEWSAFQPPTDAAREDMQARLTTLHNDFIKDVSAGRGYRARAATRASRFGEGRMFHAAQAVPMGLADAIQSPREFYRALLTPTDERPSDSFINQRARLQLAYAHST